MEAERYEEKDRLKKEGQTHTKCTRCPDLVYLTVNSLDGIQLFPQRLTTPQQEQHGTARLSPAHSEDKVTLELH